MLKKRLNIALIIMLVAFTTFVGFISAANLDNSNNVEHAEEKTYSNENLDFAFSYPGELVVFQSGENFVQLTEPAFVDIEGEIPSIKVTLRENSNRTTLSNWFAEKSHLYVGNRDFNEARHSGVVLSENSGKQLASTTIQGLGELKITIFQHGDNVIEFTAHSLTEFEKDEKLVSDYDSIINSYVKNQNN